MKSLWTSAWHQPLFRWGGGVAVVLGAASIIWAPFASGIGVLLTATALLIAVAIYRRQSDDSDAKHRELMSQYQRLGKVAREESVPESDTQHAPLVGELDPYTEAAQEFATRAEHLGDGFGVLPASEVPLAILTDLLVYWEQRGETGRWRVSNLVGAARREGRGNNPWVVAFRTSDGGLRYWRVSRGGRGKAGATVREVSEQ